MNEKKINPLVFLGIGITIAALPLFILFLFNPAGAQLSKAEQFYSQGENGKTIAERTEAFNQALALYLNLEKEYSPINGNGKLYYNIGNTYYQLSEYPLAIFYYYQSQLLMPRSEQTVQNLKLALSKIGLPPPSSRDSPFSNIFFFHVYFSLPERMQFFAVAACMTLIFASLYIWLEWKKLKLLIGAALIISIVFFCSICYSKYLAPAEAVVIQASSLYRDAGDQYAKVQKDPVQSGTKVEVLAVQRNGAWLKVLTSDGMLGYLPQKNLRLLQN